MSGLSHLHTHFTRSQPLSLCLSAKWRDQSRRFFLKGKFRGSSLEFEDVIFGTKKGNNLQQLLHTVLKLEYNVRIGLICF